MTGASEILTVQNSDKTPGTKPKSNRIVLVDIARGIAFCTMVAYHLTWDLEFFGFLESGTTAEPELKYFARAIASSFLFLVGVGLVLAHGQTFRLKTFIKRFAMVLIGAAAITISTLYATPDAFIFFGILHLIAFSYLAGLFFVKLPWWANAAIALAIFTAGMTFTTWSLQHPFLIWIGMTPAPPISNDFVPVFPWFSAVLAGIASTQLAAKLGFIGWLKAKHPNTKTDSALAFIGRHSLVAYLLHQPILFALVGLAAKAITQG